MTHANRTLDLFYEIIKMRKIKSLIIKYIFNIYLIYINKIKSGVQVRIIFRTELKVKLDSSYYLKKKGNSACFKRKWNILEIGCC